MTAPDSGRRGSAPALPRTTFACLWCGQAWTVRTRDDLEGFAQLCPDCLGKAGDNPFLRFRLRAALDARASSRTATTTPPPPPAAAEGSGGSPAAAPESATSDDAARDELIEYYEARAGEYDDWYLRRGRYEHGPIHDAAWHAELDAAGRWLDGLAFPPGRIVELAAGTGWWSPLLASKGELWSSDAAEAPLDRARERLLAHGLRAHLHLRDAWAEPEGDPAAGLFAGFWLSHVRRDRTKAFLDLASRWLRPGGRLALIDSLPDPQSGATDHPRPTGDRALRRLGDGREFTIDKVVRSPAQIEAALIEAGYDAVGVETTGRFFVLATALRP